MIGDDHHRKIRREAGFTLLELLIAITLMAMMAAGIWTVLHISIRSWSRGTEAIDAGQRHRNVLAMAQKQIAALYPLYTPIAPDQQSVPSLIFYGTATMVRFVSLNSMQFSDNAGLMLVSYETDRDADGNTFLAEKEIRYTGQIPDEAALSSARPLSIFDDLMSCVFEYYDPGNTDNPPQWVSEWDGSALNRLPSAIRMTMVANDSQGGTLNRQIIVPLHAQENQTGSFLGNRNFSRMPIDRD